MWGSGPVILITLALVHEKKARGCIPQTHASWAHYDEMDVWLLALWNAEFEHYCSCPKSSHDIVCVKGGCCKVLQWIQHPLLIPYNYLRLMVILYLIFLLFPQCWSLHQHTKSHEFRTFIPCPILDHNILSHVKDYLFCTSMIHIAINIFLCLRWRPIYGWNILAMYIMYLLLCNV